MKKTVFFRRLLAWLTVLALLAAPTVLSSCEKPDQKTQDAIVSAVVDILEEVLKPDTAEEPVPGTTAQTDAIQTETPQTEAPQTEAPQAEPLQTEAVQTEPPASAGPDEHTYYYTKDDVALYLHVFGHLPDNYITKAKAQELGWDASKGNLWDVADGFCIGGDRFGNYEGRLPKKGSYKEADVNYSGGFRGADRLIFATNGGIWYTGDHYSTFEKLY
ncbi:MAG: hypothetical protein MJ175_05165 [Clostridia bacterium]|nr:hypothetical protein [Clostridia bacterium]